MRRLHTTVVALCALAAAVSAPVEANAQTTGGRVVVLVRHAEKEAGDDPALTPDGAARARTLVHVLSGRRLEAVYVSEFRRTRDTGAPAADAAGLTPIVVEARDVEGLARAIRAGAAGTTLVVGHSNTVPALISALGAPPVPEIPESAYDDLFVVTLSPQGGADVVHLKYGAPTPPG